MKRRLVKLVVFLLLGAVVNVAVAWACAAFVHPQAGMPRVVFDRNESGQERAISVIASTGHTRLNCYAGRERFQNVPPRDLPQIEWTSADLAASSDYAGWPFLALMCTDDGAFIFMRDGRGWTAFNGNPAGRLVGGIALTPFSPGPGMGAPWRALPCTPIWPGFAINTLFYAVILWLLFAAPFALRRWRRIRRGLCPACAYPVGDSPVCTECGKALQVKRVGP